MDEQSATKPTVAIIGGGYAGVNAAKALDEVADVVLIEPKDAFMHNVAALRALAAPAWLPKIYFGYQGLLSRGRVVRDRAVAVDAGQVTLASGARISAHFIVLATGSSYPFPAKSDVDSSAAAQDKTRAAHAALAAASGVLLVGAGPVGIELAGEIKVVWPDRQVTIVDLADDVLGASFAAELKAQARRQLSDIGIELVLGSPLRENPPTAPAELRQFTVVTESGIKVTADIWFRCYGVAPVSGYLTGELAAAADQEGFITVTPYLQVTGQERVFAIGDVAAADAKMAGRAGRQAQLVAANIRALITGAGELAAYQPLPPAIIIPIGPDGGTGQLPDGQLAAPEFVAQLKGRHMMVDRYAELFGVPVAG